MYDKGVSRAWQWRSEGEFVPRPNLAVLYSAPMTELAVYSVPKPAEPVFQSESLMLIISIGTKRLIHVRVALCIKTHMPVQK